MTFDGDWVGFEEALDDLRRTCGIAGLVAGVRVSGEAEWTTALGLAGEGRSCSVDTAFEIASLTKPVMSLVLVHLVEAGALDPDEALAPRAGTTAPLARTLGHGPPVTVRVMFGRTPVASD